MTLEPQPEEINARLREVDGRLRLAAPGDAPAICGLYEQLARERWIAPIPENMFDNVRRFLESASGAMILTVEAENRVGGMAAIEYFPAIPEGGTQVYVNELVVDELLRNRGLGSALVAGIRVVAEHLGACRVYMHVREDNEAGRRFCKHHEYHRDVDAVYFMTLRAEDKSPGRK